MAAGGLVYTASFQNVTVTAAAQNIWEIIPASGTSILIHSIRFTPTPSIVSGVAQDIRYQLTVNTLSSTGTGGTAVTPTALNARNTVAALTTFNRTVTTPGAVSKQLDGEILSIIVPFERIYTPDQRIPLTGGQRLAFNLTAWSDAASHICGSEIYFEEI